MRAVITGHTAGIGLAINNALQAKGWDVIGLSRTTNFDVKRPCSLDDAVSAAVCGDLLINNIHHGFFQTNLLYAMADRWGDDPSKTVVVIGSDSSDGIKAHSHRYACEKAALDKAVEQLQRCKAWRLMIVRPGYVDTDRVKHIDANKLPVSLIAETVMWMIEQPPSILIRRIDLAPR